MRPGHGVCLVRLSRRARPRAPAPAGTGRALAIPRQVVGAPMRFSRRRLCPALVLCRALLTLGGCSDDSQSPPARVEPRPEVLSTDEPGNLAPLDLVYVCGNKFLATNSNPRTVELTWRVIGSS